MSDEATIDLIRGYWEKRAKNAATDTERIDQSERSQKMRYAAFLDNHDLSGRSILDVGCGIGDLWRELQDRKVQCEYIGFDISQEMIRICKIRYPSIEFVSGNILEWNPQRDFDYVASFGIHSNVRVPTGLNFVMEVTMRQYNLCTIAAHTSLLTDRYKEFGMGVQSWNAENVLTQALKITPYVSLQHHYLPHDFGITLYRRPLVDSQQEGLEH